MQSPVHLGVLQTAEPWRERLCARGASFFSLSRAPAWQAIKYFVMQMFRNNNSALRITGVLCEPFIEWSLIEVGEFILKEKKKMTVMFRQKVTKHTSSCIYYLNRNSFSSHKKITVQSYARFIRILEIFSFGRAEYVSFISRFFGEFGADFLSTNTSRYQWDGKTIQV